QPPPLRRSRAVGRCPRGQNGDSLLLTRIFGGCDSVPSTILPSPTAFLACASKAAHVGVLRRATSLRTTSRRGAVSNKEATSCSASADRLRRFRARASPPTSRWVFSPGSYGFTAPARSVFSRAPLRRALLTALAQVATSSRRWVSVCGPDWPAARSNWNSVVYTTITA